MSGNVKKTFVCILVNNVHYIPGHICTTDCHVHIPGSQTTCYSSSNLHQSSMKMIKDTVPHYGQHINSSLRVDAHRLGFDAAART